MFDKENLKKYFTSAYTEKMISFMNNLKKYQKEIDAIYYDLNSNKKLSYYKIQLYVSKINLLYKKITDIINDANKLSNKEEKVCVILGILSMIYNILFFPLIITPFGLPISLIGIFAAAWALKKVVAFYIDDTRGELLKEVKNVEITLENCETQLNKQINCSNKKEKEKTNLEDIELADKVIREYMESDDFDQYIDDNICNLIVKILQDDLKTEESDVNVLLDIARDNLEKIDSGEKKVKLLES